VRNYTHEALCYEQYEKVRLADYRFAYGFGVGFEDMESDEMKIIFRVYKKIPVHLLYPHEKIPRDFRGCRTKVIEKPHWEDHKGKLIGGSQITTFGFNHNQDKEEGAIGIIRKTEDNNFEGITNFHVIMDPPTLNIGDQVIYPPKLDATQEDVIGTVLRASKEADCAVISIQKRPEDVRDYEIRQIGIVDSNKASMRERMRVLLYSPVRRSLIEGFVKQKKFSGYFRQLDDSILEFNNLFLIRTDDGSPFSLHGDSGSLVVDKNTHSVVGLLKGGDDDDSLAIHWKDVEQLCSFHLENHPKEKDEL